MLSSMLILLTLHNKTYFSTLHLVGLYNKNFQQIHVLTKVEHVR